MKGHHVFSMNCFKRWCHVNRVAITTAVAAVFSSGMAFVLGAWLGGHLLGVWAALSVFALLQIEVLDDWRAKVRRLLSINFLWSMLILCGLLCASAHWLFLLVMIFLCLFGGHLALKNDLYLNVVLWGLCFFALAGWAPVDNLSIVLIVFTFFMAGSLALVVNLLVHPTAVSTLFHHQLRALLHIFDAQLEGRVDQSSLSVLALLRLGNLSNLGLLMPTKERALPLVDRLYCVKGLLTQLLPVERVAGLKNVHTDRWRLLAREYLQAVMSRPYTVHHAFYLQRLKAERPQLDAIRHDLVSQGSEDFSNYFQLSNQLYHYMALFELLAVLAVWLVEHDV